MRRSQCLQVFLAKYWRQIYPLILLHLQIKPEAECENLTVALSNQEIQYKTIDMELVKTVHTAVYVSKYIE